MPPKRVPSDPTSSASPVHVALLRGINVGGRNMIPTATLASLFADAGCDDVRSYIQSGNFVFRASPALASRLPSLIADRILDQFGIEVPVVLRTANELDLVARNNPFVAAGADVGTLHVAFLAGAPSQENAAGLDPQRSPPDRFEVRGRDIYLCLPNGVARTKLTNGYLDARLKTTSTLRNWRTVLRLVEIARE